MFNIYLHINTYYVDWIGPLKKYKCTKFREKWKFVLIGDKKKCNSVDRGREGSDHRSLEAPDSPDVFDSSSCWVIQTSRSWSLASRGSGLWIVPVWTAAAVVVVTPNVLCPDVDDVVGDVLEDALVAPCFNDVVIFSVDVWGSLDVAHVEAAGCRWVLSVVCLTFVCGLKRRRVKLLHGATIFSCRKVVQWRETSSNILQYYSILSSAISKSTYDDESESVVCRTWLWVTRLTLKREVSGDWRSCSVRWTWCNIPQTCHHHYEILNN